MGTGRSRRRTGPPRDRELNPARRHGEPARHAPLPPGLLASIGAAPWGSSVPVAGSLFTNATSTDLYGDGSPPDPLRTYLRLTEDLKGDNVLATTGMRRDALSRRSTTRAPVRPCGGHELRLADSPTRRRRPSGSPPSAPRAGARNRLRLGRQLLLDLAGAAYDPATGGSVIKVGNATNFGMGRAHPGSAPAGPPRGSSPAPTRPPAPTRSP